MNKDIQTLIEREARRYTSSNLGESEVWPFDTINEKGYEDKYFTFLDGAHFALSLFKWRKVSEEDIPVDQLVILRLGDYYTLITISYKEIAGYANDKWKDGEWMPIPQID